MTQNRAIALAVGGVLLFIIPREELVETMELITQLVVSIMGLIS